MVSLGPWSPDLLQKFDYRFPMLRKRGYHRHFSGGGRLNLPLHDPEFAYAMAPMAKGLRITSGAELMGPERLSQSRQLERAEQAARRLVDLGTAVEAEPWSGVAPACPTCCRSWALRRSTRACGCISGTAITATRSGPTTGRLLAELMSGEQPFTDPSAFSPARFGLSCTAGGSVTAVPSLPATQRRGNRQAARSIDPLAAMD